MSLEILSNVLGVFQFIFLVIPIFLTFYKSSKYLTEATGLLFCGMVFISELCGVASSHIRYHYLSTPEYSYSFWGYVFCIVCTTLVGLLTIEMIYRFWKKYKSSAWHIFKEDVKEDVKKYFYN